MAARDRFGSFADPSLSPLQRAIHNACEPTNYEPNLALNLEVADLINQKKGNAPREAAIAIVHLINSRNQNVALLALALLDICVKNCGYPFHLQISTKEFLNELVRRFPERPPVRPSRVQHRILESIEEWRQTICQTSRYKEDLGFIRDMHRLLLYKGYHFPEVRHEDAAVLNPSDTLRSAEEMEEEERAAQSAKLQELIRRGTPHDLQEANRLMKVMAGYDTRNKTDYRAKAAEEVSYIQQKAKILEEMLQSIQPGDKISAGDVFEELANALQSAHPKIQKMCDEESDDTEAVEKLKQINDSIQRTIQRYKLVKAGDFEGASRIPKGTLGTTTGVGKNANNELSLIDFDPEPSPNGQEQAATSSLEDDLLGLSFQDRSAPGPVNLGFDAPIAASSGVPSAPSQTQGAAGSGFQRNYDILSSLSGSQQTSQSSTPAPVISQATKPTSPPPAVDPFASLISASSMSSSPMVSNQGVSSSSAIVDLLGSGPSSSTTGSIATTAPTDDEWSFTSALPTENTLPATNRVRVLESSLVVDFEARRKPGEPRTIQIMALFSNKTSQPLTELHFQVAVERAYHLKLQPQTGRDISPLQSVGVKQEMLIENVDAGKGNSVKVRFKVSYRVGGKATEEQGMVPQLGIS
ncbi:VHS domain protein [Talaromyces stipitatus ATCC 10500]|uniref:VHS domain protein n=1 Tax=Talaromyces stipitatus (strain ATCC 10500 / CBS 375.48 / QM 6759 / NRRL 1006) TaxID=441959 RepID=B8LUK9_TALSN|nr:VHS domain protein [Talaromyces stipitatus ATCC 10500]EED23866.1 VHS domain protein [Talaromyces stipitatus ATCC 10500]